MQHISRKYHFVLSLLMERSIPGGVEACGNAIAKRPAFNSAVSACLGDTIPERMIDASHNWDPGRLRFGLGLSLTSCMEEACSDGRVRMAETRIFNSLERFPGPTTYTPRKGVYQGNAI